MASLCCTLLPAASAPPSGLACRALHPVLPRRSFIGLKSLQLAIASLGELPATADANAIGAVNVSFIPFEFDPPGTYPQQGQDWAEYCEGYGPAKARFLLEQKLPRAFELGAAVGITFSMKRRLVSTEAVNSALELAQEHGKGLEFALEMLSAHFERLRDPNDPGLICSVLAGLGVPSAGLMPAGEQRAARNAALTAKARSMNPGGGVPKFFVRCTAAGSSGGNSSGNGGTGDSAAEVGLVGGGDACEVAAAAAGTTGAGPTSPAYFERGFRLCVGAATACTL